MSLPGQHNRELLDGITTIPSAAMAIALDDCIKAHQNLKDKEFNHYLINGGGFFGDRHYMLEYIAHPMGNNRLLLNAAITEDLTCHDTQ